MESLNAETVEKGRISIPEVASRLAIGRAAVYAMLEKHIIPGIRLGRRWIITRHAYDEWERTCGRKSSSNVDTTAGMRVV